MPTHTARQGLRSIAALLTLGLASCLTDTVTATEPQEWPQLGGSPARNNAARATGLPVSWNVGKVEGRSRKLVLAGDKQVRWAAALGSECYNAPVVAGGKVFVGTNNAGYAARYPAKVDLGCLVCFSAADGKFLWQHSVEKLKAARSIDYPEQGICSVPLVEGKRLWVVTNRGEVVCLDSEGFGDGRNDGPFTGEAATGPGESDVIWRFDMMRQLGSVQRYMASCSVTAVGDLLLVCTSNGTDDEGKVVAPDAPSFIALDKQSGKLVWADASPGGNILEGQWSSPAAADVAGTKQVVFGGGDGWLYSFAADNGANGKPRLLWKFDCNPKDARWEGFGGTGRRNHLVAAPTIVGNRLYACTGQDPEAGEGPGDLWCVDMTRTGDASPELVLDASGRAVPPGRTIGIDTEAGQKLAPNPASALVWHYQGEKGASGDDDFKKTMHRSLGSAVVCDGLLVVGDFAGLLHCLDAQTGKALWTEDLMSAIWGTPLVADGKIYVGTADGDVWVFALDKTKKQLAKNPMGSSVTSGPVAVGKTLYIATKTHLFAIQQ